MRWLVVAGIRDRDNIQELFIIEVKSLVVMA